MDSNISGKANYSNIHNQNKSKKTTTVQPTVVVLLNKEEIDKIISDYKDLQNRCEKLYETKSLKEIYDINITLHMLDKQFKLLLSHTE